jgi:hypothetical protein
MIGHWFFFGNYLPFRVIFDHLPFLCDFFFSSLEIVFNFTCRGGRRISTMGIQIR